MRCSVGTPGAGPADSGDPSYSDGQTCQITTLISGIVSAMVISTEQGHDILTVDEVEYSGSVGPVNVQLDVVASVTWIKDSNGVVGHGWVLCLDPYNAVDPDDISDGSVEPPRCLVSGFRCPVDYDYTDCLRLCDFYSSTGGDGWTNNSGWGTTTSICSWAGLGCDPYGDVTSITFLANSSLSGSLPQSWISDLSTLHLADSLISGSLPSSLSKQTRMTNLEVFEVPPAVEDSGGQTKEQLTAEIYARRGISGTISVGLAELPVLKQIRLASARLSGTLPVEIVNMTTLRHSITEFISLGISYSRLSGTLPSIGDLGCGRNVSIKLQLADIWEHPCRQQNETCTNGTCTEYDAPVAAPPEWQHSA